MDDIKSISGGTGSVCYHSAAYFHKDFIKLWLPFVEQEFKQTANNKK